MAKTFLLLATLLVALVLLVEHHHHWSSPATSNSLMMGVDAGFLSKVSRALGGRKKCPKGMEPCSCEKRAAGLFVSSL
jgi:hypothetical protein